MAAYPTLPISLGSKASPEAGIKIDRASNGAARARLFATPKRSFRVEHAGLSLTERGSLETFYNANLATSFSFTWPLDGVTYTVIFGGEPAFKPLGSGYADASVALEQV
jgi:hypothetical protein